MKRIGTLLQIGKICLIGLIGLMGLIGNSKTSHAAIISKAPNNLGLVAYWPMDEGTSGYAGDASGNGYTASLNSTTWTNGKHNKGLSFNGSTSYLDSGTKFPSITSAITISIWVKPSGTQVTYADILGNHQPDFKGMVIQQSADSLNQYTWGYGDGSGWTNMTGTFSLTSNVWQHLTVVKDASYCYVYINGVENVGARGTCSSAMVPATSMNFRVGMGFSGGGRVWNGTADDVRVYSRALTPAQIVSLYQSGQLTRKVVSNQDLLGYWAMNEGKGETVGDSSGKQNNGNLVSGSWTSGKRGGATSLNGTSNYIYVSTSTDFEIKSVSQEPFTVSAWVKPTQSPADSQSIFSIGTTDFNSISMALDLDEKLYLVASNNGSSWGINNKSTNSVPLNQWSFVTFTRSVAGLYTYYINGVDAGGSFTNASDLFVNANSVKIGAHYRNLAGYYFGGLLDDIRIYNRVLSVTEIQNLYRQNETKINSSQNSRITNGLVGLWSFNGPDYNKASTTAEVLDRSGYGNNGNDLGVTLVAGKSGQGISASNQTISVPDNNSLDLATSVSVSLWINPKQRTDSYAEHPISKWTGTTDANFVLYYFGTFGHTQSTYLAFLANAGGIWQGVSAGYDPPLNEWTHVGWTYSSSSGGQLYINGSPQGALSGTGGTLATSTAPLVIGNNGSDNTILLDEVRVYNRVLPSSEMKQLYNIGR